MKKQIIQLVDDLDGTVIEHGEKSVQFSLDGRYYEIDLSSENVEKLRSALAPFIQAGRTSTAPVRVPASRRSSRSSNGDLAAIRTWAQQNGYTVGDRGRIAEPIRDAYNRAH